MANFKDEDLSEEHLRFFFLDEKIFTLSFEFLH